MGQKNLYCKVSDYVTAVETTVLMTETVEEALARIRSKKITEKIFYLYVVDEQNRLKGVVSTRSLLLTALDAKIAEILEERVISVSVHHTLQEAVDLLSANRLLALPVIDEHKKFLGVIDIQLYLDDAIDVAKMRQSSTDLFHVLGLSLEEKTTSLAAYKVRMPWICCNMIGGIGCAIISRVFELVLLEVILLAMFIPLVLTLSESIAMQSMTYSLQLLHKSKISWAKVRAKITTEAKMAFFLGCTCAVVVGSLSILWKEGFLPAVAIGLGILLSVTISGTVGALIPLLLHMQKLDPKVAAGPVVLMLVDVITTAIYLGFSAWLLL